MKITYRKIRKYTSNIKALKKTVSKTFNTIFILEFKANKLRTTQKGRGLGFALFSVQLFALVVEKTAVGKHKVQRNGIFKREVLGICASSG